MCPYPKLIDKYINIVSILEKERHPVTSAEAVASLLDVYVEEWGILLSIFAAYSDLTMTYNIIME